MERLKKARAPFRSQLTKLTNQVGPLLQGKKPDIRALAAKLELLEHLWTGLEDVDRKILDQMLDDDAEQDEIDAEHDAIKQYEETYVLLKQDIKRALQPPSPPGSVYSEAASVTGRKKTVQLPVIPLRKFDGELKNWLGWWSQFRKIHDDEDIDDSDKFQYLVSAIEDGTEAKEIVSGYPQSSENYELALEALREHYGDDDIQLQYYVRELLSLIINNVTSEEKLSLPKLHR